jgi:hypothetical protein
MSANDIYLKIAVGAQNFAPLHKFRITKEMTDRSKKSCPGGAAKRIIYAKTC